MRVKVGDSWYEVDASQPIMIELTDADKANIAAMPANARFYAVFDDGDTKSREEKLAWMDAGVKVEG